MVTTRQKKKRQNNTDYDSAWKDVLEELFEPFMEFFFPEAYDMIDFSKGFEFMTKELRKLAPKNKTGKRYPDEVVKVYLT